MTALYWRHHVKKDNEDFEEDMNPKVKQRRSSLINRKVDADRKVWIRDILEVNNHFSFDTPGQRSKLRDHHAILGMKTTADQKLDLEIEKVS
jgi:LAS superfamily LD-carboxypeptidase LdcB